MGSILKSNKPQTNNSSILTDSYVITKTGKKVNYHILSPEEWEATRIKAYTLLVP